MLCDIPHALYTLARTAVLLSEPELLLSSTIICRVTGIGSRLSVTQGPCLQFGQLSPIEGLDRDKTIPGQFVALHDICATKMAERTYLQHTYMYRWPAPTFNPSSARSAASFTVDGINSPSGGTADYVSSYKPPSAPQEHCPSNAGIPNGTGNSNDDVAPAVSAINGLMATSN
ncbi:hypothetical protein KEM54_001733 [Ascosphaera aggregata]|nr:hypothetical protein KEM54_001733 [Ascosphaera aggregata]